VSEPNGEAWVEVGRFDSAQAAGERALVLVAAGIDCQLTANGSTTSLLVERSMEIAARREVSSYYSENRPGSQPPPALPLRDGLTGVLAYWCALVFVYAAASQDAFGRDWFSAGASQTGRIFAGEWYRVITALGLHADLGHLSSNLVAGSLFGFFASEVLGSGLAWLMILIAGSAGNAINAFFQPASHTSVGASTAIFGAIGLLAVVALKYRSQWKGGLRRWAPLAAGLMLLAFLGTEGERVDVGAHLAGFVAGGLLGVGILMFGSPAVTYGRNIAYAVVAVAVFLGSWVMALVFVGA